MYNYLSAHDNAWVFESVRTNLGFLIKYYRSIISEGYNQLVVTTETLPLLERHIIGPALDTYLGVDELPQYPFDISKLIEITSWEKNQSVFSSTEDMLNTIFHDPERLGRLSRPRTINYDLDGLISRVRAEGGNGPSIECAGDHSLTSRLIKHISKTLRQVKQGCYSIQCERLDNARYVDTPLASQIRPLVAGTVDMFYLGALKLLSEAYDIKTIVDLKNGVDDYMKTVMTAMHPGANS
jgi:hypothetical protein